MQEEEILTLSQSRSEEIMLRIRLLDGIRKSYLTDGEQSSLENFLAEGYLNSFSWERGSVVLSTTGRLIADRIVREILL
jgi:coproporphyrinogen III oxidase-like Fe-S oxidoreductase